MQALGNDFVVVSSVDLRSTRLGRTLLRDWHKRAGDLARALCDRHYGIGADGLILVVDPQIVKQPAEFPDLVNKGSADTADVGWVYTNADGSSADMCGNGLRCLALFAVEKQLVQRHDFVVATAAGTASIVFTGADKITIDLGEPLLQVEAIPLQARTQERFVKQPLTVVDNGRELKLQVTCVNMGNPHCVIFDDRYVEAAYADPDLGRLAECIQKLPLFPEGVNVEFAAATKRDHVRLLVWERGCGATLACATGAAATLVAGVLEGRIAKHCTIELPGGVLEAQWSEADGHVRLTGPASQAFTGQIDLLNFPSLRGFLAAEAICS